ncbi:MAG: hypothetical protein D6682_04300 [Zetaproteobacteria bacterium]|nr:MAG: hypothetical protein D6682_04300 [Zetaproteobacteria bacterium]
MEKEIQQMQAAEIAEESRRLAEDLEAMARDIRQTAEVVRHNSGVAGEAARSSRQGEELLARLVEATEAINQLSQSIAGIAKHTNLLALNASIEAVRAGASGRGFAVVASEVKELANQSAEATKEIQQRIDEVLEQSKQAHEVLSEIAQEVSGIHQRAGNAADGFDQKADAMEELARRMSTLQQKSEELAAAS